MKREEILAIYEKGPDAVVALVEGLWSIICDLQERVKILEDQFAQNSRNSSKPPSTDENNKPKPKSRRKSSGRKPGGQKGHPGQRLERVDKPDHTVNHQVHECQDCGKLLDEMKPTDYETRQVFDLPPIKIEVTEHVAEIKHCDCGCVNRADFPEHVTQPTQYGQEIKSFIVYLSQYQLLPYERIQELFSDLFGHHLSKGTLVNTNHACYHSLEAVEKLIKEALVQAKQAHFDETGFRIKGKRQWLHVASTSKLTYYESHVKRGKEAMDSIDILSRFNGKAIHDHWKSYFRYKNCTHGLCNAHHLRELTFVHEQFQQEWAKEMSDLLVNTKRLVDERRPTASCLTQKEIRKIEGEYEKILLKGFEANPEIPRDPKKNKRGRKKKTKPQNLLARLSEYRNETLAFIYDFDIPFDNNQGERDIRMMKVKQKISGTFRSEQGAKTFCRIRGYISTIKKQAGNVLDTLNSVFNGTPFIPALE